MKPDFTTVQSLISIALAEDHVQEDITTALLVSEGRSRMALVAEEELVACGARSVAYEVFRALDTNMKCMEAAEDGSLLKVSDSLLVVEGQTRALLSAERTALNFLQRLCGVATLTRQYVEAVKGTGAKILDTRKTIPGWRMLDKYAVRCGGGVNHRMSLADAVMVKDNHWAGIENRELRIGKLVERVRQQISLIPDSRFPIPIIIECDTLDQVREALAAKPDRILLDNMSVEMLAQAVAVAAGSVDLEASGGVNLSNVRAIADTGVGYISVGAITHSAPAANIKAELK